MEKSSEDRVADLIFGEEPVEEPAEEPVEEVEASREEVDEEYVEVVDEALQEESQDLGLVEVEYDGVTYEVPPTLKDALMRQSDYTQKTQSVADERRAVEVMRKQVEVAQSEQKFIQDIQPELNHIGYLKANIQQMEAALQSDRSGMTAHELMDKTYELSVLEKQVKAITEGLETRYKDFEEAQKQSYQELLEKGAQVLKQAIPGWSEEKQKAVRDYALSKGFSQQEVSSIIDPRHVQILYAAQQYEAIQSKAKPAAEKAKGAPSIKPKARDPMPNDVRQRLDLKNKLKSNKLSANQKAKLIAEDFGKRFG